MEAVHRVAAVVDPIVVVRWAVAAVVILGTVVTLNVFPLFNAGLDEIHLYQKK